MLAPVQDVHHRHGQTYFAAAEDIVDMLEQRHFPMRRRGFCGGEGHRQDRIGAETRLVAGAVQVDHRVIEDFLVQRVDAADRRGDFIDDTSDGFQHAPARKAFWIAIPKLKCLARSGGCAGRREGVAARSAAQYDFRPHRGVAAGVEDFLRRHVADDAHGIRVPGRVPERVSM